MHIHKKSPLKNKNNSAFQVEMTDRSFDHWKFVAKNGVRDHDFRLCECCQINYFKNVSIS